MNHSGSPGIRALDVWDVLRSAITTSGSIGEWAKQLARFTELASLKVLHFFRAETLGTDITDGGGAVDHGIRDASESSHTRLTTGNVIDDDAGSYLAAASSILMPLNTRPPNGIGTRLVYETRFLLEQLATTIASLGFGDQDADPAPTFDGAVFLYDPSVDPNWHSFSQNGGSEDQDTGIVADIGWHVFRIEVVGLTSVLFFIDGVLVTTHVTRVPIDETHLTQMKVMIRTRAAAVKYAKYEYVAAWNE